MKIATPVLAGASLLALATPAAAQQTHDRDTIVVTAERLTAEAQQQVRQTPGGAQVVAAEAYEDKAAVSLRDALALAPGVYAQPRFGQEVRLSVRGSGISRGYHMRGLTLLQDGVPINLADDNGDFQELDPLALERIEVFRGANALRFGASTLGGAINGVTPTGRSANGIRVRVDGGSFGTIRGFASAGFADAAGDAYLSIAGDRSDGDRDHARRRAIRFTGNAGLRLTDTVETRFYANVQAIDQELPGALTGAVALSAPATGNFAGDQHRDIDSMRVQNRTRFELGDGALDVGAFLNAKKLYHPIFQVVDQKSTDWGAFARLQQDWGSFGLAAGATARFGTVDAKRFVNVNGKRGAPTFAADQAARTVDAYAEVRFRPIDRLTLIAGAIYTAGMRRQQQVLPAAAFGRSEFDQLSPKLGLLFEPADDLQFYANFSRSHELPGFIELAQVTSFVPLDAQRGWTAEAGARGTLGPVSFDLSVYRADLTGELLQYSVAPPTIPVATFNAGDTRHQGVEMRIDVALARWATLRQSYTFSDFRFRDDVQFGDNRLPVIPEHFYRAELALGTQAYTVTPNVEWTPSGAFADYANGFRATGYVLVGATAQARLDDRVTLFADAGNLFDRRAIGDIGAVVVYAPANAIFYPVERRAFYGGIRARF